MKIKLIALLVFFQIIFFDSFSFAKTVKDFFLIEKLPSSVSGYSSSEAKKAAISYARAEAFDIVLSRLVMSEDLKDIDAPRSYDIEKFVQTIKLNNEKTTSTSYSADIDVKINKKLIQEFLDDQDVKFLKDFPPSTLIIFKDGDSFDFQNSDYGNKNVVSFVFHKSYPNDNEMKIILDGAPSELAQLLSKYNASNVIVVENINYSQDLNNNEGEIIVSFKDRLFGMENTFSTTKSDYVNDLVRNINDSYKLATSDMKLTNKVSLIVPLFNLADWIDFEKKLSSVSDVKSYNVVALKFDKAQIEIEYNYDVDSVVNAFKKLGLNIEKKIDPSNNNYYLMIER